MVIFSSSFMSLRHCSSSNVYQPTSCITLISSVMHPSTHPTLLSVRPFLPVCLVLSCPACSSPCVLEEVLALYSCVVGLVIRLVCMAEGHNVHYTTPRRTTIHSILSLDVALCRPASTPVKDSSLSPFFVLVLATNPLCLVCFATQCPCSRVVTANALGLRLCLLTLCGEKGRGTRRCTMCLDERAS
jgi:hypothetical protein